MKTKHISYLLIGLFVFNLLAIPLTARAEGTFHVAVEYLDNSTFPWVEAYVSVSDQNGIPIKGLDAGAFSLVESGTPAAIQEFKPIRNTEQPLSIVLVMDTSTSMGSVDKPTPMQRSVDAAKSFVDQLEAVDRVAVIKFSDKPEEVISLTDDKARVKLALDSLEPEKNKTAMYDGIVAAVKALTNQSGRRIIVVVTDGKDTGTGLFDFDAAVNEAQNEAISIYPMGFGGIINVSQLRKMAELTGGVAQILPKAIDLQTSFTDILNILREQYFIQYVSSRPADDKDLELLVSVDYGGGLEQTTYHFSAKSGSIPISLPSFQPGQVVGGIVKFAPTFDWLAPLKSLEILVDGTQIAKVETKPFEYSWNAFASKITPGTHDFLFKAVDIAGNTGQSTVSLNVQPPITIEITSPTDGSTVSGSAKITAKVTTLPGVSVSKVAFMVGTTEIAAVPGNANQTEYEAAWNTRSYTAMAYPVSVVVYDTAGLFTTSKNMLVNVHVGNYSWMFILIVLAVAALIVPIAMRSRRRRAMPPVGLTPGAAVASVAGRTALRELEGMNPNQVWPLGVSEVRLGRKRDENDIPLQGLKASRRQGLIRFEDGLYVVYSLSAGNPVLVNEMPVPQMQVLKPGDLIRMGDSVFRFEN
jgi:VWFA-related protein